MKIAFITRSTLHTAIGGDTFQITNTARQLNRLGIVADIKLTSETIDYSRYDLLHFFNIGRPADMLTHIDRSKKPFVVSPNLVNYHEYDQHYRKGLPGFMFRLMPKNSIEYAKTIARFARGNDGLSSISYLWHGQKRSIIKILRQASLLLPNSHMEYEQLKQYDHRLPPYQVIPNGIDPLIFAGNDAASKEQGLVLCVARIEGIKNQLNLIKALNHTRYRLVIIGAPAPNQASYYHACKKWAAPNISFIDHLPQQQLVTWYRKADIHILPSWFETCGLSTLEAAAMGCKIVITDKGYTREYYENEAEYCDPASPRSILQAVENASGKTNSEMLKQKIATHYTWQQAAWRTIEAYKQVLL